MSIGGLAELDFIEELRLRRWARENYVPRDSRSPEWHPIIIEEMAKKDLEGSDSLPNPTFAWMEN